MPKLDKRLQMVAKMIRCTTHADIGSDHGNLLKALLLSQRIARGIAVENKRGPFENSRRTLAGLAAEVRFGSGFGPLLPNEVGSASICGMGGQSVVEILSAFPQNLPPQIITQPNTEPDKVRIWGLQNGFHLLDEQLCQGRRLYRILHFQKCGGRDPAYEDIDRESAIMFGPWQIKRRSAEFLARLEADCHYLRQLPELEPASRKKLAGMLKILNAPDSP